MLLRMLYLLQDQRTHRKPCSTLPTPNTLASHLQPYPLLNNPPHTSRGDKRTDKNKHSSSEWNLRNLLLALFLLAPTASKNRPQNGSVHPSSTPSANVRNRARLLETSPNASVRVSNAWPGVPFAALALPPPAGWRAWCSWSASVVLPSLSLALFHLREGPPALHQLHVSRVFSFIAQDKKKKKPGVANELNSQYIYQAYVYIPGTKHTAVHCFWQPRQAARVEH